MTQNFDLIVIGTGTAGSVAAKQCRSAGWNVAIIDCLPFGGTCALRGCDPKKMLVSAEEVIDFADRMASNGIAGFSVFIHFVFGLNPSLTFFAVNIPLFLVSWKLLE